MIMLMSAQEKATFSESFLRLLLSLVRDISWACRKPLVIVYLLMQNFQSNILTCFLTNLSVLLLGQSLNSNENQEKTCILHLL